MARIPYLEPADLSDENKDLLKRPIWLAKALVNSPNGSKLDPRLRELAILQVGWLAKSPYEWSHHVKLGHDFGVSYEDVQALIDDTDGKPTSLDAMTKMVLKGAREITDGGEMTEATFTALQAALGNELVLDLTLTIAFYNAVVRVLGTLKIDVEPEYQPYLDKFPLRA
jgi:alkylhydroperoxidase family enzyme